MTSSNLNRDFSNLQNNQFDVVIIGGGITGAWLSLHCAQQGLSTALVERGDYASETSSASSKLLHGGIRYLQQFQFDKVRESALERAHYIYAAPQLSTKVPFIVPTYRDFKRSKLFLNCGMLAYRALCLGENKLIADTHERLPGNYSINAKQLNAICDLEHEAHTGGVVFYERHMLDSERMVLAIIESARKLGAITYNYVSVTGFAGNDSQVTGVEIVDQFSKQAYVINSKLVINAAGPFIDNLNRMLPNAATAPSINGYALGSHIITRQLCDHAIALTTKHQSDAKIDRGGRHVFVIPWRGYSLIGTSYDEIDTPNGDLSIKASHVDQLLEAVNEGFPSAKLSRDDIISGYSGLYPLQTDNIESTVYQGTGEYQIIDHQQSNLVSGLITALGAKFTTGRKISELTMKLVGQKLGCDSKISKTKLHNSQFASFEEFASAKLKHYTGQLSHAVLTHLLALYGSDIDAFMQHIADEPQLKHTICASQPDILGQVSWAVLNEQAYTLEDVLYRRTSLGLLGIESSELSSIADIMAKLLGWSAQERSQQISISASKLSNTMNAIRGAQQ